MPPNPQCRQLFQADYQKLDAAPPAHPKPKSARHSKRTTDFNGASRKTVPSSAVISKRCPSMTSPERTFSASISRTAAIASSSASSRVGAQFLPGLLQRPRLCVYGKYLGMRSPLSSLPRTARKTTGSPICRIPMWRVSSLTKGDISGTANGGTRLIRPTTGENRLSHALAVALIPPPSRNKRAADEVGNSHPLPGGRPWMMTQRADHAAKSKCNL